MTLQSHFTISMHFHSLQNPPSFIVPTASNIPSNLYNAYLQERTHTPPPLSPAHPLPQTTKSPTSCPAPIVIPSSSSPPAYLSKITTSHKHIHPHHRPVRPAPGVSSKSFIHHGRRHRHSGHRRHCQHQISSRIPTSSTDTRHCPGPMWSGMETRSCQELDVVKSSSMLSGDSLALRSWVSSSSQTSRYFESMLSPPPSLAANLHPPPYHPTTLSEGCVHQLTSKQRQGL